MPEEGRGANAPGNTVVAQTKKKNPNGWKALNCYEPLGQSTDLTAPQREDIR